MSAHSDSLPDHVPFRTLDRSGPGTVIAAVLVLVGIGALFLPTGDDHGRVWRALLFNWLFWASLAQGMVMLAVAWHLTNARWSWSVRRFALAGVSFLPVAALLFVPIFWFGYHDFFHHWIEVGHDPVIEAKRAWLSVPGMFARDFAGMLLLFGMSIAFARLALRPDVYGAGRDAAQKSMYARLTGGFRGVKEEAASSVAKMHKLGVFLALGFAFVWGMVGVDMAMTMMPHWFSTMFPVAFFMAAFHAGIAGTVIAAVYFRRKMKLQEQITSSQFHDLGKLTFAFAVFWMYLNWSQYVVQWYGLLPHEQEWWVRRFEAPFTTLSQLVPLLIFVIPFFGLLTRPPKKVPAILATFAGIILVGNWLERFMITTPSVYEGTALPFGLMEVGVAAGFAGLFLLCYTWFLKTFPVFPSPAFMAAQGSATIEVPASQAPAGA
jgi:hypothetical protein